MKLVRLTMKNFMPYKDQAVIDFPKDESRNVMLVFGDNMRGKTSLLNALRWGFYEKALGSVRCQIIRATGGILITEGSGPDGFDYAARF